jgi:peptidyl-prolyl cis-trans isomerase B (cyclophilin B)
MPPTKRESDLARARAKRLVEIRAAQARKRRVWYGVAAGVCLVILIVTITLAVTSGGGDDSKKTAAPVATIACGAQAPPAPKLMTFAKAPAMTIDKTAKYTMTINTSCGPIVIALDAANAPQTVNSFNFLASKGYFNGIHFSRLTTGTNFWVLQGGDQSSNGQGSPGYTIPDENLAKATYPRGGVAMANAGKNTGGSQFFLIAKDANKTLTKSYTRFGTITSGLDVLDKLMAVGNNSSNGPGDGQPKKTIYINTLTVTKS